MLRRQNRVVGVNGFAVGSYCVNAFRERAGERGENSVSRYMKCCTHRVGCNGGIKFLVSEVTR